MTGKGRLDSKIPCTQLKKIFCNIFIHLLTLLSMQTFLLKINFKCRRNLFYFLLRQFFFYFQQYHLCPHPICVSMYVCMCVLILAALCCLSALSRSVRLAVGVERAPQSTPYRASSGIVCVGQTTDTGTQSISLMKCNNCQVYLVTHSSQGLSHRLSLSGGFALMNRKSFCVCVAFGLLPGSTFSKSDENLFSMVCALCGIRMGKLRGR